MEAIDEKPTLAEWYSAATESSNLRVKETRCDADFLIAAGWGGTGIGPRLLRLRGEFDAIKGARDLANDVLLASEDIAAAIDAAAAAERAGADAGPTRERLLSERADERRKQAQRDAKTSTALIMVDLGDNLYHVKAHLGDLAVIEATRTRFMENDERAAYVAGRCLEAWLDPNCPKCEGRGYDGGGRHEHTGPKILCRSCSGSGKRRTAIGNSDEQRRFAGHLLNLIEQAVSEAEKGMARVLYPKDA